LIRDNVMSQATRDRNDSNEGPIKKPDIFGTYSNIHGGYKWETLYGEISFEPFVNSTISKLHIKEDRIKLGKFSKDSLDSSFNYHNSKVENFLIDNNKLNIFLLHSSGK